MHAHARRHASLARACLLRRFAGPEAAMTAVMRATSVRSAQAAVGRRAGAGRRARRAAAAACAPPTLSVTVTDGTKGGEQVGAFEVVSGEKLLRDAILEEGISLYKGFAKGLNCGGVGQVREHAPGQPRQA